MDDNSIMDWPNKCCAKCRKPLVREETPYGEGWRLDCKCWDEPQSPDCASANETEGHT